MRARWRQTSPNDPQAVALPMNRPAIFWTGAALLCLGIAGVVSAFLLAYRIGYDTIFDMPAGFGPRIEAILQEGHYYVESDGYRDYIGRPPFLPHLYALLWSWTGSIPAMLVAKNLIFGGLLSACFALCCRRAMVPAGVAAAGLLLLFAFPFNAFTMLTLSYEEALLGFLIPSILALAIAERTPWDRLLLAGLLAVTYLTKSSAFLFCGTFAVALLFTTRWSSPLLRTLPLLAVLATAVAWGGYSAARTGTFAAASTSSSTNGWNLWKGNNPRFAELYPDRHLDELAAEARAAAPQFGSEWEAHRYYTGLARDFVTEHPGQALRNTGRKLSNMLFGIRDFEFNRNRTAKVVLHTGSMLVNRVLLFAALGLSLTWLLRRETSPVRRRAGGLFLLLAVSYSAPFLVGFAYSRHLVPVFVSAVLVVLLAARPLDHGGSRASNGR
ncbi:hypothetical protein [Tropicimonas aquimaris]|uniref:Glycosyltransferase RgtA/B/C/D-like domain-containing protein n=1 Tax=Tropicimonas aquimaris TaxID=914152 RepID=A0ABW3IQ65_9RHOB